MNKLNYKYSFERLNVWQEARRFVTRIYKITQNFPDVEKFGLTNQIRRASVSIPANIAEGTSRNSKKDQAHFTNISYGSLMEVLSHLYISLDLNFITQEDFNTLKIKIYDLSNQINALHKSQLNR